MDDSIYPYIGFSLGILLGVGAVLGVLALLRRRKPHLFLEKNLRDTALTVTIVGLAFALLAFPLGNTYMLLGGLYGVAGGCIGFGVVTAVQTRKAKS